MKDCQYLFVITAKGRVTLRDQKEEINLYVISMNSPVYLNIRQIYGCLLSPNSSVPCAKLKFRKKV